MIPTDRDYFYVRAETELTRAQRAEHPAAMRAHYILAGFYLDLVYPPDAPVQRPIPRYRAA
jgi:hypothetical protein